MAALWLAQPARAETVLAVEMITAERGTGSRSLSLTGEIEARATLSASFPLGGRIAAVEVSEGDAAAAGAVLVRIEQVQQEQALRSAEAGLVTALADQRQAADTLARQDALLERGATTRSTRDQAADALQVAEASVAQAEAERDSAQKSLADTVLLAPADAIVTARLAEVGQVVGAAQAVVELALGTGYDAVFEVPEVLLSDPPASLTVELALLDRPGERFSGKVRELSPLVDSQTGTVTVTVGVTDPPPGLTYGAAVRGTVTRTETARVVLPFTVLTATTKGPAVWIIEPETGTVALRQVDVLRHETGVVVISGGLEGGEQVVGRGAQLLYPGRKVRPVVVQ